MMKKYILIIACFYSLCAVSNSYEIGSKWKFSMPYGSQSSKKLGYAEYTAVKDTIVDSYSCVLIHGKLITHSDTTDLDKVILRQEGDSVFSYSGAEFQLMYDFSLEVGDTLNVDVQQEGCDSSFFILDELEMILINGVNRKKQTFIQHGYRFGNISTDFQGKYVIVEHAMYFENTIYQHSGLLFKPTSLCYVYDDFSQYIQEFRCFDEPGYPTYTKPSYLGDCKAIINSTNFKTKASIKVKPTIVNGHLDILSDTHLKSYVIYSLSGAVVSKALIEGKSQSVNVSEISPGLYLIRVEDIEGNILTSRIVVQ